MLQRFTSDWRRQSTIDSIPSCMIGGLTQNMYINGWTLWLMAFLFYDIRGKELSKNATKVNYLVISISLMRFPFPASFAWSIVKGKRNLRNLKLTTKSTPIYHVRQLANIAYVVHQCIVHVLQSDTQQTHHFLYGRVLTCYPTRNAKKMQYPPPPTDSSIQ